jgi:peptidoglycan biosynthesis protein MviN/MurJ (putative lipid II flippase)
VLVSSVLILMDVSAAAILPASDRLYGLAFGLTIANFVGAAVTAFFVRRRFGTAEEGPDSQHSMAGSLGRMLMAGLAGAAAVVGVAMALSSVQPKDGRGAVVVLTLSGLVGLIIYVGALVLLGVDEALAAITKLTHGRRSPHQHHESS